MHPIQGHIYFELPSGVTLLDPVKLQPTSFLSQQTYIPGIPEPASMALWSLGPAALGLQRRRTRHRQP